MEQWKEFFSTAPNKSTVFDILDHAIAVAASDFPDEFSRQKTRLLNSIQAACSGGKSETGSDPRPSLIVRIKIPPRRPPVLLLKLVVRLRPSRAWMRKQSFKLPRESCTIGTENTKRQKRIQVLNYVPSQELRLQSLPRKQLESTKKYMNNRQMHGGDGRVRGAPGCAEYALMNNPEENVEQDAQSGIDPLNVSLYQMDLDRTQFLLRSYLRIRLQKIEKYIFHILATAELYNRLSKQEKAFAKTCLVDLEKHLEESVLLKLPNNYQSIFKQSMISEENDMVAKPLSHPRTLSAVTRYCPLWAHRLSRFCFRQLRSSFPVGHPSWDCSSINLLNLGVPIPSEAAEPPKGLALDWRWAYTYTTHNPSPLADVGYYNPPPWESDALVGTLAPHGRVALIPLSHPRTHSAVT
ncbi:hypothetical protein ACLB2K_041836 [Fragaria x ananassa]